MVRLLSFDLEVTDSNPLQTPLDGSPPFINFSLFCLMTSNVLMGMPLELFSYIGSCAACNLFNFDLLVKLSKLYFMLE